jgi:hypothetical protein
MSEAIERAKEKVRQAAKLLDEAANLLGDREMARVCRDNREQIAEMVHAIDDPDFQ